MMIFVDRTVEASSGLLFTVKKPSFFPRQKKVIKVVCVFSSVAAFSYESHKKM